MNEHLMADLETAITAERDADRAAGLRATLIKHIAAHLEHGGQVCASLVPREGEAHPDRVDCRWRLKDMAGHVQDTYGVLLWNAHLDQGAREIARFRDAQDAAWYLVTRLGVTPYNAEYYS